MRSPVLGLTRKTTPAYAVFSPPVAMLPPKKFPRTIPRTHKKNRGEWKENKENLNLKNSIKFYRYKKQEKKREKITYGLRSQRPCVRIAPGAPQISSPHEESLAGAFFVPVVCLSGRTGDTHRQRHRPTKNGASAWRMPRSVFRRAGGSPDAGLVVDCR